MTPLEFILSVALVALGAWHLRTRRRDTPPQAQTPAPDEPTPPEHQHFR